MLLDIASTFLEGQADKQWASESDDLGDLKDGPLTWSNFEHFLLTNFRKIAPMTQYFKEYEACEQTTTVTDYVSRLRTCLNKLKWTFLEVSPGIAYVNF
jgi:hypothetical protein